MAAPDLLVIPSTPHVPASISSHTQSSGSFRSSSEDTAVTIFSMYTDARDNWAANAKVISLNDVDPVVRNGDACTRVTKPPSAFQNGLVVLPDVDHRHSITTMSYRASEDSVCLPYTRNSMPPQDKQQPPPSRSPSQHFAPPRDSPPALPSPLLSPQAGPSGPSPDPSLFTQRSEGEDPDSFHIRSTYAQLEAEGVRGDGYEEGVELTRAKQGGTTYLTSQPHDRGRPSDINPAELAVLASVDRSV